MTTETIHRSRGARSVAAAGTLATLAALLGACGSASTVTVTAPLATAPAGTGNPGTSTSVTPPPTAPPPTAPPSVPPTAAPTAPPMSHPLDPLGPAQGTRLAEVSGTGNGFVPASETINVPKNNWVMNLSYTCPDGSSGHTGFGTVITFDFLRPDGSPVPGDPQQQQGGDWAGGGGSLVPIGGPLRVKVTPVSAFCQWHLALETGLAP